MKVIILVTGFKELEPWNSNWKECERTWVPLLRELGYDIKISFGDPNIEDYFLDEGNHIKFKASIGKDGVLDKRLKLPIRWILEHTDYDYYFCVDSDSFIHPKRFDSMLKDNIKNFSPDYMGFKILATGIDVNCKITQYEINDDSDQHHYASGCAYMISRKVMPQILPKLIATENWMLECEDWILGKVMKSENILLLNETSISIESHQKLILGNPHNLPTPYIGDKNSFLSIQHYTNGLMDKILLDLKDEVEEVKEKKVRKTKKKEESK